MSTIRLGATATPTLFSLLEQDSAAIDHTKVDADGGIELVRQLLAEPLLQ
jgi:hypothetical protein